MELGPGIMGTIFDGIQRPLKTIARESGDVFIPRGVNVHALDFKKAYEFDPTSFKVGVLRLLCSVVLINGLLTCNCSISYYNNNSTIV